jgi:hypothetical protein
MRRPLIVGVVIGSRGDGVSVGEGEALGVGDALGAGVGEADGVGTGSWATIPKDRANISNNTRAHVHVVIGGFSSLVVKSSYVRVRRHGLKRIVET